MQKMQSNLRTSWPRQKVILGPAGHARSARPDGKKILQHSQLGHQGKHQYMTMVTSAIPKLKLLFVYAVRVLE